MYNKGEITKNADGNYESVDHTPFNFYLVKVLDGTMDYKSFLNHEQDLYQQDMYEDWLENDNRNKDFEESEDY